MEGPVLVSNVVLAGLKLVARAGIEDRWDAMLFLFSNGNEDTADWLANHRAAYWDGLKNGFALESEVVQ